ncbi:MAG: flagellar export protein FliJ [Mycobacterium leprae]
MKRFRFTLEKVLRVRAHRTDEAKQRLAEALLAEREAREALRAAESSLAAFGAEWERQVGKRLTVMKWEALNARHEALVQTRDEAVAETAAAEALTEQRRVELAEARRQERILETLQEHQWVAYQKEALAAEQAELDEIGQHTRLVWKEAESV